MSNRRVTISPQFFQTLSPMFRLSRLFCLWPLKWENLNYAYSLRKSRTFVAYSLVTIALVVAASIYGLSRVYRVNVIHSIRLGTPAALCVDCIDVTVVLSTAIIGVVATSSKIDKFLEYFYHLDQFDSFLDLKDFRLGRFKLVTGSTLLYTTVLLVYQTVIWVKLGSRDLDPYSLFFAFLPYNLTYVFTVIIELVYWHLVYCIKTRVDALNDKLSKFGQEGIQDLLLRINKKKINSIVDTLQGDLLKRKHAASTFQIQNMTKGYLHLAAAKNSVNECYGFVILVVVLGCFLHLLVTPYLLRSIVLNTADNEVFIVSQSIWMMGHILRLFLIVEPCDGCFAQSKNTSLIIFNLLCSNVEGEVRKSLKFLLLCLSQSELDFTAFGLTRIHRRILTAIAGAVTTYLVILFQFN